MTIHVIPIPSTVSFAEPAYVLGLTNSAGGASTAIASDSTLLVFDAVLPDAVAASSLAGVAVVAARRDHVHAAYDASNTLNVMVEALIYG